MNSPRATFAIFAVLILIIVGGGVYYFSQANSQTPPTSTLEDVTSSGDTVTVALGQKGVVGGVSITPTNLVEDSRCPADVQCIQAGRVRVQATLMSGLGTSMPIFLVGESVTTEVEAVTLTVVTPTKRSTVTISDSEYRFTFKVVTQQLTYDNASADVIKIDTPAPGDVVGKQFDVRGQARDWYFEGSFPVRITDPSGNVLVAIPAEAQGDWMVSTFVPFVAHITILGGYTGPATVSLHKDNPSGLPQNEASVSYPITIEY